MLPRQTCTPGLTRLPSLPPPPLAAAEKLRKEADAMVRTLVDMEASYLSASFFREIVAAESYAYDPSRPRPAFYTLNGENL